MLASFLKPPSVLASTPNTVEGDGRACKPFFMHSCYVRILRNSLYFYFALNTGGEGQRLKLAKELLKQGNKNSLYLLDEPTTGLHPNDVTQLLNLLNRLVDAGNTVIMVEHNSQMIKGADWIIDLGPQGGDKGGQIIAEGTPDIIVKNPKSYTGKYL